MSLKGLGVPVLQALEHRERGKPYPWGFLKELRAPAVGCSRGQEYKQCAVT